MRRTALIAVITTMAAPLIATATASSAHAAARPNERAASRAFGASWLATQARAMTATNGHYFTSMTPAARAESQLPAASYVGDGLQPAGKLAGGKDEDVFDLQQDSPGASARNLVITLRHGRTGAQIWRDTYQENDNAIADVQLARVGSTGVPGFIVTIAEYYSSGSTENFNLVVDSYVGKTGEYLTGAVITGSSTSGTFTGIPSMAPAPLFHGVKGPDTDLLFTTTSGTSSAATGQTWMLVGSHLAQTKIGGSYVSQAGIGGAYPVPDLNGDGLDDVVITTPTYNQAVTAAGKQIWKSTATSLGEATRATSLGDLSHSAYPDLLLNGSNEVTDNDAYLVINGRTGHIELTVPSTVGTMWPIRHAGPKHLPAIGMAAITAVVPKGGGSEASASWRAVGLANHTIWKHSAAVSSPAATSASYGSLWTGDVIGDGSLDQDITLTVSNTTGKKSVAGYIDNRNGDLRRTPATVLGDGSFRKNGTGDDLLLPAMSGGTLHLTAWRGSTRKRYYSRSIPHFTGVVTSSFGSLRASSSPCSDISVVTLNSGDGSSGEVGVLSGRGTPLWTVSFGGSNRGVGTLHHYATPKQLCE